MPTIIFLAGMALGIGLTLGTGWLLLIAFGKPVEDDPHQLADAGDAWLEEMARRAGRFGVHHSSGDKHV